MVVTYPAKQKTGNRAKDVLNSVFKESEQRVYDWLIENGYGVRDARGEKTFYDFRIGAPDKEPIYALDVKTDQYAQTTGRVAWEIAVDFRGVMREGWGRDEKLDYVAFVMPGTWDMIMVDAEVVRDLLDKVEKGFAFPGPGEWVAFKKEGSDGRTAFGVAVGLEFLNRHGAIKREANIGGDS